MENLISGSIVVFLCTLGYFQAWRASRKAGYIRAILLIMACGFFLRAYVAADRYLHEWDERYHALVAKNIIDDPLKPTLYKNPVLPYDYRHWAGNHVWLHKQPLPLWSMALSMKLFGINELALRLPSVLLSTLAIWLTFGIARYFLDTRTALLAAFLQSIHGLSIELSGGRVATDHIDVFFQFFIGLGIFLSVAFLRKPKWHISMLIGGSIGLAILCKWLPALIIIPVWLVFAVQERISWRQIILHLTIILSVAFLVAAPWQFYIFSYFPREAAWEYHFNTRHIFEGLDGHGQPWYYHFDRMRILFGELIYLPLAWLTYKGLKKLWRQDLKYLGLLLYIWIPYLFFSLARTKMQAYVLFTAPAFFILTALFFRYLKIWRSRLRLPDILINIILILLIALPVRYSIERVKPFSTRERNPGWARELRALNRKIHRDKVIIFGAERPVETMFYTNAIAYPFRPEQRVVDSLQEAGCEIYIQDTKINSR